MNFSPTEAFQKLFQGNHRVIPGPLSHPLGYAWKHGSSDKLGGVWGRPTNLLLQKKAMQPVTVGKVN